MVACRRRLIRLMATTRGTRRPTVTTTRPLSSRSTVSSGTTRTSTTRQLAGPRVTTKRVQLSDGPCSIEYGPSRALGTSTMTRRILLSGLFFIGALNGSAEHTTLAYLTTAVRSTANSFSAGTLHIADSLAAGTTLSMDNLVAGDSFDAQLNVDNHGSLSLAYGLSTSIAGSSALANALDLTVRA